ncbi:hypothetical protein XA68_17976 [Ophiocordyceps unilateralis]|uniref:Uncharacterized protein n=1 Tax=Ophiocordyceps unilateralis TaxID=268505 RepID=A0A2A9P3X9_OPHUN|nr:hypothetical protein XA68_17976 [Ophiocordyceps unilateralis]
MITSEHHLARGNEVFALGGIQWAQVMGYTFLTGSHPGFLSPNPDYGLRFQGQAVTILPSTAAPFQPVPQDRVCAYAARNWARQFMHQANVGSSVGWMGCFPLVAELYDADPRIPGPMRLSQDAQYRAANGLPRCEPGNFGLPCRMERGVRFQRPQRQPTRGQAVWHGAMIDTSEAGPLDGGGGEAGGPPNGGGESRPEQPQAVWHGAIIDTTEAEPSGSGLTEEQPVWYGPTEDGSEDDAEARPSPSGLRPEDDSSRCESSSQASSAEQRQINQCQDQAHELWRRMRQRIRERILERMRQRTDAVPSTASTISAAGGRGAGPGRVSFPIGATTVPASTAQTSNQQETQVEGPEVIEVSSDSEEDGPPSPPPKRKKKTDDRVTAPSTSGATSTSTDGNLLVYHLDSLAELETEAYRWAVASLAAECQLYEPDFMLRRGFHQKRWERYVVVRADCRQAIDQVKKMEACEKIRDLKIGFKLPHDWSSAQSSHRHPFSVGGPAGSVTIAVDQEAQEGIQIWKHVNIGQRTVYDIKDIDKIDVVSDRIQDIELRARCDASTNTVRWTKYKTDRQSQSTLHVQPEDWRKELPCTFFGRMLVDFGSTNKLFAGQSNKVNVSVSFNSMPKPAILPRDPQTGFQTTTMGFLPMRHFGQDLIHVRSIKSVHVNIDGDSDQGPSDFSGMTIMGKCVGSGHVVQVTKFQGVEYSLRHGNAQDGPDEGWIGEVDAEDWK